MGFLLALPFSFFLKGNGEGDFTRSASSTMSGSRAFRESYLLGLRALPYELSIRPKRSGKPALTEVEWGSAVLSTSHQMPPESAPLPFVIRSVAEGSAVLQAPPGNVFRGSGLSFEARRACPELVEGADRQTSAQPGRAGESIPGGSERRRRGTLYLNLHQCSVESIPRTSLQNSSSLTPRNYHRLRASPLQDVQDGYNLEKQQGKCCPDIPGPGVFQSRRYSTH
jgi:hypothetical protein